MNYTRNVYAILLASLVIAVTILSLMGIWGLIPWENLTEYFWKGLYSLLVLFISGLMLLFIFSAIFKRSQRPPKPPNPTQK